MAIRPTTYVALVAAGLPVLLATLSGITDGVPPGALIVISPGQTTVQAN